MSKKKTDSEKEMLGPQMSMENMNGGAMTPLDGEMPTGDMMDATTEILSDQMKAEFSEMPLGDMTDDKSSSFEGSTPTMVAEMPQAQMNANGGATPFNVQNFSGGNEMPSGSMEEDAATPGVKQHQSNTIEIPGSWKLQLTYSS